MAKSTPSRRPRRPQDAVAVILRPFLRRKAFGNARAAADTLAALAADPISAQDLLCVLPRLLKAFSLSADADMALANFDRLANGVVSRTALYSSLGSIPAVLPMLSDMLGSSEVLADVLVRNPEYLDWLCDPLVLHASKEKESLLRELLPATEIFPEVEGKMDVFRRFRRREMLRIGTRDLMGLAPLEKTVGELSEMADAMVEVAMHVALREAREKYGNPMGESGAPARLCVMGMGKLGGRELNYSSDIDLMFVYSEEGMVRPPKGSPTMTTHEFYNRVCARVIPMLSAKTKEGYVFRVDMRLRPEGDAGPLARSLDSYENFYATWGETWHRMALIRARPIAGDTALGAEFLEMTRPFVYRKHLTPWAVEELRRVKGRIVAHLEARGRIHREVKLGYGGIRELEFGLQLMQLVHGAHHPELQGPNTLAALKGFVQRGLLTGTEAKTLEIAYRFLRRVEHFLQIVHETQTHELPERPEGLKALARRLGYRDKKRGDALHLFRKDYGTHTKAVHAFHARVYGVGASEEGEDLDFLLMPKPGLKANEYLSKLGFLNTKAALETLSLLAHGPAHMHLSPATVRLFRHLVGKILLFAKESGDADMALKQFERVVAAQGPRTGFYKLLEQHQGLLRLLMGITGNSPDLTETLVRHPEFMEALVADPYLHAVKPRDVLSQELRDTYAEVDSKRAVLFKRYEMLRIGTRDVMELADLPGTLEEISNVADVLFSEVARGMPQSAQHPDLAVLALGKWGSRELGYYSDLDLLFVHDTSQHESYQRFAQALIQRLAQPTEHGLLYKVDARLRPGGKSDVLVPSWDTCRKYYGPDLQTWERQALTRTRFVYGNRALGEKFLRHIEGLLYKSTAANDVSGDVRRMRDRMTREKVSVSQRGSHVKLDVGGIVDIEFAVQLLQLCWGYKYPSLRRNTTLMVLQEARHRGLLEKGCYRDLREGYLFLRSVENKIRMLSGLPSEVIPAKEGAQVALMRRLGLGKATPQETLKAFREAYKRHTTAVRRAFDSVTKQRPRRA